MYALNKLEKKTITSLCNTFCYLNEKELNARHHNPVQKENKFKKHSFLHLTETLT